MCGKNKWFWNGTRLFLMNDKFEIDMYNWLTKSRKSFGDKIAWHLLFEIGTSTFYDWHEKTGM